MTLRQISSSLGSGLGLGIKRTHRSKIGNPQMRGQLSCTKAGEERKQKLKQKNPPSQNHLLSAEARSRKLANSHPVQGIKTLGRKVASFCPKPVVGIKWSHSHHSSVKELLLRSLERPRCDSRPLSLIARGQETSDGYEVLSSGVPPCRR